MTYDMIISIIGTMVGFVVAFLLFWLKEIRLYEKRHKERMKSDLIKNQLEKLYAPLYLFLKSSEWIVGKRILGTSKDPDEKGKGRQKQFLDKIIENYLYLANDELHKLLPRAYGPGYYKTQSEKDLKRIMNLIESDYKKLRKEYFDLSK